MRCILTLNTDRANTLVRVYKDTDYCEYIAYYVINGIKDEPSSYHSLGDSSTDKADAIGQAHAMACMVSASIPTIARA